jgi:DUF4097 and DUF4098 domain-containing protein YvlB
MTPFAFLFAIAVAQSVTTDTTIRVRAGMRLNVDLGVGSIVVRSWDRQDVRIVAMRAREVVLAIDTAPAALNVRSRGGTKGTNAVQYQITVPRAMNLTLGRGDVDVDVAGTQGEIVATVRKGTITVDGGRGLIDLHTAHGAISIVNARGRISARTLNSDIRISDSGGDIEVEGADGDVVLARLDAERADISTVDGRITYEGPLRPGGHYTFATHEQGVRLSIPANSGATITMATVVGSVSSDFPFTARTELGKGRFSFVIGDGAAQVSLSSFEGRVEVRRMSAGR